MFICRLRFLSRPSPSFCSHVIITQRFSSRATTPSQQCLAVSTFHATPSSQTPMFDSPPSDHLHYLGDNPPSWSDQDTDREPLFPINQEETEKKVDSDPLPTLCELYARLSTPFSKPTPLSIEQVHGIAIRARKEGCKIALDNLTRNILESPEPVRSELARALLSIPYLHLNPSLTASLLSCTVPNLLSSLSLYASTHTAHALMYHPSPSETKTFLACLVENIAETLKLHQRYTPLTNWEHATRIWTLFRLVMHLSKLHMREPAMRLLQSLIETSYIPPEAIHRVDHSSGDFHLIVTLTLVRSCIFWNWNRKALVLMKNYLSEASSVGPAITKLCQDVLYTLMEFPTKEDLGLSLAFIKDAVSSPKPLAVSPGIVRQMYANAQHLNQPHIATSLFTLSLDQAAHSLVEFPLPSGSALTWLLRHLSRQVAHIHLTRCLVEQVVDRCEHIPLANRAEFISIAARSGFASPARTLWVRYSSGKEGRIVAGNAAMVVRMCSLFATLRQKALNKSGISQVAAKATISSVDSGLDDAGIDLRVLSEEEGEDLRKFANLVLTRFREAKEPLQQASREDLNALARANIILGHVKEGLDVLRVVLDQYKHPDLHDVNVVLSAIAEVDPRTALKMVRHMVVSGPRPDGVSFGTVVYQAARHGNVAVITGLLRLAREIGQQLTTKTVAAVIRASVVFSGKDKERRSRQFNSRAGDRHCQRKLEPPRVVEHGQVLHRRGTQGG
ncbi:hypothetical protein EDB87DRAFT_1061944 [Lactarius vividus]|nr:hypothetical protein EDB87DRAFT_1061944 [Lactarius vividus]